MPTIVPIKDTLYYLWNNFSWPSPKHITQNLSPIPVCLHHGPAVSPGNLFRLSEWLNQPSNYLSPKPRRQNPCRISSLLSILQKALIILALTVTQMHPPARPTLSPSTSLLIWSAIKASFMCSLLCHSCLLSNSFINQHWVTFFKHKLDMAIPLHKNPPWLPVVFRIKSMSNSFLWPLRTSQLSKLNSSHSSIHSPLPTPVSLPSSICRAHPGSGPLHVLRPLPETLLSFTVPMPDSFSSLSLGLNDAFSEKLSRITLLKVWSPLTLYLSTLFSLQNLYH